MKQLFIIALICSSVYSFAQQRPNSKVFSDSLTIKNSFGNQLDFYENFQIQDLKNNNGYAIINSYDDISYAPKYLMMKFDIDGNQLMDTIYDFTPLNAQGWVDNVKSLGTLNNQTVVLSSIVDTNFNTLNFLFTLDASNNVIWNTYFNTDTLSNYPNGMMIDNANNEILVYGEANNNNSNPQTYESFISKLDGSGNVLWTKIHGMEGSDTNRFNIRHAAIANDGNYLFAGDIYGNMDMKLRYYKTDINGNVIWNMPFNFTNLPGNDSIDPGNYKGIHKIFPLKNGNAVLVGSYTGGMTETQILFTIGFDQSNGTINFARRYYLPFESIYVEQIEMDNDENILISCEDMNAFNNYIAKIDKNGIVLSNFYTFDTATNTGYVKGFTKTEDDGFLLLNAKVDAQFNPNGYFLFKTNNKLLSSCADTANANFFLIEDINAYGISMNDTVYSVSPTISGSTTLSGATTANVQSNVMCDCQISISGIVHDINSVPASNTTLYLYKVKSQGQFTLFDSTVTDLTGNYLFDYLPEEQFIIKSSTNLPNTVSTYYGSPNDHVNWDSAWVFNLSCTNQTLTGKDITLVPTVPQTGNGALSGFVYDLGSFGTLRKSNPNDKALGDPIPDIDITVNQSPGGTVGISTTDGNGGYNFTGLNVGASFIVTADIPGLPNDSTYTINITVTNNNFDSLNFYIDSAGVYILDTNLTTSISVYNDLETAIELMPNPTQNNVNLVIQSETSSNAAIRLTSYTGSIVSEKRQQINKGKNTIELVTDQLSSGIYFIQIQMNNKIIVKKLVKQ